METSETETGLLTLEVYLSNQKKKSFSFGIRKIMLMNMASNIQLWIAKDVQTIRRNTQVPKEEQRLKHVTGKDEHYYDIFFSSFAEDNIVNFLHPIEKAEEFSENWLFDKACSSILL